MNLYFDTVSLFCILTLTSIMFVAFYKSSGKEFQVNNNMFEKGSLLHST